MKLNFLPYLQFADNTQLNSPSSLGDIIADKDVGGVKHQQVLIEYDDGGTGVVKVSAANGLPVTDATLAAKDFATQTTLAALNAKIPASPATEGGNLATLTAKDFATQATLALIKLKTDNLDLAITGLRDAIRGLNSKTLTDLDTDLATVHTDLGTLHTDLTTILTTSDFDSKTGSLTETAPATDIASSGLNGRLQRIAQNITTLIAATLKTSVADGSNIVEGALADAIVAAGATGSVSAKLRRVTQGLEDLKTLIVLGAGTNVIGHVINDAGTALMGKVGIDQTTQGTTNAISGVSTAANLTATTNTALLPTIIYAGWSITHLPATATKATISKSAGATGVRHVCTGFTASLACGATAQTPITVSIRDGGTGAGTVLWSATMAAPVNGSCIITQSGLCLIGTAATAMTIEFSAAGVTASQETVSLQGFSTS